MILTKSKINSLDIDQLIFEKLDNGRFEELLLIVPTNRKIRYLKREIITNSPNQSISEINLETLATLSTKLFVESVDFNAKILSDSAAVILLNQAFQKVELQYFNSYRKEIPRGTLELVKNVISEYKRHGLFPEDIKLEADALSGSEKFKALDIAAIYEVYQNNTKKINAYEIGDIYQHILNLDNYEFSNLFNSLYPDTKTIIINGFDEFSEPEIELINLVSNISGKDAFISFDYYKYNNEIFVHLERCYQSFIRIGFHEIEDRSRSVFNESKKYLRENLFSNKKIKQVEPNFEIIKIAASNTSKEIEIIAKEIKSLIINEKVDANEICVAFNLISEHSDTIRDLFNNYGIPFNLTDRYNLSNSAPVISLINFLEIIENDFYYKNIFRALSGRWIEIKNVDLSNLLAVSANLKLVAGFKNWMDSLENVINLIQNETSDDENNYLYIWQYEKAKSDLTDIFKLLESFKNKLTINNFRKQLFDLIIKLKFSKRLINDAEENIEKNVKALTVFVEIINEVLDLLEDQYGKHKTFTLSFLLHELKTAFLFSRYNIKERHDRGVLVTSVNEIRGLKFKYLFLGGMVDGEFPTRFHPAIFFTGKERAIRNEYKHLLEERYRFYQSACVMEKRLYLTYSSSSSKKELTESSFINDLAKLFQIKLKSESEFDSLIYSKEEMLKLAGKYGPEIIKENIDKQRILTASKVDLLRHINPFDESAYTGFIKDDLGDDAKIKLQLFNEKEYSATQLEEYAKCPFKYFLNKILSLTTIEEPKEEIEAFEIGSLVHSIFYKFYKELKEKEIVLAGCSDKDFKLSEKLLFDIAQEKISNIRFASAVSFYEKEKIFGINGKKENSILYQFLLHERQSEKEFVPKYFEYAFGNFSTRDSGTNFKLGNVSIRGKIDRIDVDENNYRFKVVDYKLSGKKPTKDELLKGISLQLPLYMYVSKLLVESEINHKADPVSAEIYSLKLSKNDFGRKAINTDNRRKLNEEDWISMNEEMIHIALESINRYVNLIADGDFRLSQLQDRENKICSYCDFKSICRIRDID